MKHHHMVKSKKSTKSLHPTRHALTLADQKTPPPLTLADRKTHPPRPLTLADQMRIQNLEKSEDCWYCAPGTSP